MALGRVKWFNDSKGFGFIETKGGEVFVHWTAIRTSEGHKTLAAGQEVEFDVYEGQKGPEAQNVTQRE